METKNAIDYIKESSFYSSERYLWLKELIDSLINDNLTDEKIQKVINKELQIVNDEKPVDSKQNNEQNIEVATDEIINIKKINSINKLSNIGLLQIDKKVSLKDRLNVFYGKNGSGKSSVYLGMCKTLGHDKNVYSNINKKINTSSCEISITDEGEKEHIIEWKTGKNCDRTNVKIFDIQISNFIVENDQLNQFELAYLKTEYFVFLHNLFYKIYNLLQYKLTTTTQEKEALKIIIDTKASVFFEYESKLSKEKIKEIDLTENEKQSLIQYKNKIELLKKTDTEAIIKNISTAKDQITSILNAIGSPELIIDENGKEKSSWDFLLNKKYFDEINKKIELYQTAKKAFEESGTNKLSSLIPLQWISNEKWNLFIDKSIDFLNSLEENDRKKYSVEYCPYCQQPLLTEKSKELISIYHQIRDEHKTKLDELEKNITDLSNEFNEIEIILKSIKAKNKVIEGELKHIGIKEPIQTIIFEDIFNKIQSSIKNLKKIENTEIISNKFKEFWDIYFPLHENFLSTVVNLSISLTEKTNNIIKLEEKAKPIRNKKILFENKKDIIKYLESKEKNKIINDRFSDISSIKQATSFLETKFSKEVPLQVFKDHLIKEYKHFNFTPPSVWNIATSTRHGTNRRVYNLGDKRLSEIFSEGEKKIHALADFFAQIELNQFKGVFIFDDPVNSLDEERMEYVKNRIAELVSEGNQVIVFTHNLVFLNYLVDTSVEKVNLINKLSNQIIIEANLSLGTEAELSKLFKEIQKRVNELAVKNEIEIEIYDLKNIYDLMSGYIESYVELKLFYDIINRYRPNIRMHRLDKMKAYKSDKLDYIISLYSQTSRKGSRHSQPVGTSPPNYPELVTDFENLNTNFNYK